jgi:hypothetical protein
MMAQGLALVQILSYRFLTTGPPESLFFIATREVRCPK